MIRPYAPQHGDTVASEIGATDIFTERREGRVARIMEVTSGLGADSVLDRPRRKPTAFTVDRHVRANRQPSRAAGWLGWSQASHEENCGASASPP
jgi:hypothetical protein